jgi:hypothetical protein
MKTREVIAFCENRKEYVKNTIRFGNEWNRACAALLLDIAEGRLDLPEKFILKFWFSSTPMNVIIF